MYLSATCRIAFAAKLLVSPFLATFFLKLTQGLQKLSEGSVAYYLVPPTGISFQFASLAAIYKLYCSEFRKTMISINILALYPGCNEQLWNFR